jgi:hypothetical protein
MPVCCQQLLGRARLLAIAHTAATDATAPHSGAAGDHSSRRALTGWQRQRQPKEYAQHSLRHGGNDGRA